jgi:hypothetical protein
MIVLRVIFFALGGAAVLGTLLSVVETFVLPRGAPNQFARFVFVGVRRVLDLWAARAQTYLERDRIMAFYAPVSLMLLLPSWYGSVLIGYAAMFWGLRAGSWYAAFRLSGSSLLTLGFATADGWPELVLMVSEATVGLLLVALLIAYLPTMYAAFSRREAAVTLLEVRAGNPPSAVEMLKRFSRLHGFDRLTEQWQMWETWFADIEESHTSLAPLVFFRSPRPEHSWVTAAGAVLDAAALTQSVVAVPADPQAALCLRAGYLALRHVADFFRIPYHRDPAPIDAISITRAEFDAACDELAAHDVPLKPDRDQAWRDFAGWRVNYDDVLVRLAGLVMAPPAPWSSDRAPKYDLPLIMRNGRR